MSVKPPFEHTGAGKKFAIVCAVDSYRDPQIGRQQFGATDAAAVAAMLRSGQGFDVVKVLSESTDADGPPDWAPIRAAMDEMTAIVRPGDLVLFYFAGYGMDLPGDGVLITRDCPHTDLQRGLTMRQLGAWLSALAAGPRVLWLDSSLSPNALAGLGSILANPGAPLSVICAGVQAIEQPELKAGLFTHFLVEAVSKMKPGTTLSLTEVAEQVLRGVKEWAGRQLGPNEQTPWYLLAGSSSARIT